MVFPLVFFLGRPTNNLTTGKIIALVKTLDDSSIARSDYKIYCYTEIRPMLWKWTLISIFLLKS